MNQSDSDCDLDSEFECAASGSEAVGMKTRPLAVVAKSAVAAFFLSYATYRLITLALASDEWGHIVSIMSPPSCLVDLLVFSYVDAQSHFLHALLSLGFAGVMPESGIVIAARLPSLLGLVLYLYSNWRLTDTLNRGWLGCLAFLALCTNAHLLDYFSLARGYGLALGFASLSIYLLVESVRRTGSQSCVNPWSFGSVWAASLAVLANMAFMNLYFAVISVCMGLSLYKFYRESPNILNAIAKAMAASGFVLANAAILGVFYLPRILLLIRYDKLYFGGTKGFVADTVGTLVCCNFYGWDVPNSISELLGYCLVASSLCISLASMQQCARRGFASPSVSLLMSAITLLMSGFNICLFWLAGIKYLRDRTALVFVLVFVLQLVAYMVESTRGRRAVGALGVVACVLLGSVGINLNRTHEYRAYSQTPELMDDLKEIHQQTGMGIVVGVSDSTKYTMGWYAEKRLGLAEGTETRGYVSGPVKRFGWLTIYSLDFGVQPGGPVHYRADTTHVVLQSYMDESDMLFKLKCLKRYPHAGICLYEVER